MTDPYSEFSTKKELFDRRGVKLVLFVLIPGIIFALVSAAIRVSEYGIDHTILVFGDKTWVKKHAAAIRVSLMADDGRFFLPEKLTAFLKKGETRHMVYNDAVGDRGDAVAVNMMVPDVSNGLYILELDIRFDKRRRTIEIPITVTATAPKEGLVIPADSKEKKYVDAVALGDVQVHLTTEDRGAPTGITSTAFLRVQKPNGEPVSKDISYAVMNAPPVAESSDKLGLLALILPVKGLSLPITLDGARHLGQRMPDAGVEERDAGAAEVSERLYPNVTYSGISLSIHTPIAAKQSKIKVTIEQVSSGGPVYANLFHHGRFVQGTSGFLSGQQAVMSIRPKAPGLYRLQVSTTSIGAEDGVAVRHFYVLESNQEPVDGLRDILKQVHTQHPDDKWVSAVLNMDLKRGGFDLQKAAAYALSRLYAGHRHPVQLISSRLEDDRELTAFKTKFQRMMMVAIIALGIGVCCFIGLFALAAHRRQQRLSRLIMEEDDNLDKQSGDKEESVTDSPKDWSSLTGYRSTGRVIVQGAVLFFIVLGAFVAIALLVDTLTWRS